MLTVALLVALVSSVTCFDKEVDEKFHKLPHDEFVKYFNNQNFTYKITNYDGINEKAVSCSSGVGRRIIPIPVPVKTQRNLGYAPPQFDGRVNWRYCYRNPMDQGECPSCWAIATAAAASIRRCLMFGPIPIPIPDDQVKNLSDYFLYVDLSPADLICCKDCYSESFCGVGSPTAAALYWLQNGLVSKTCKPYELSVHKNETSDCKAECVNDTLYYNADKYFGDSVTVMLEDDHEIRKEIFSNGPVVATFFLHEDLRDYKEGVYEHTHGEFIGVHSVIVIGYGVENGTPYWLAANTWGDKWGDKSTFKVKRFDESLLFEKQLIRLAPRFN